MKKTIKLQTTDDLKRVVEFEAEHAKRILDLPNTSWEKAPKDATVTETYPYPKEETVSETVQEVPVVAETVAVEGNK